MQLPIGVQKVQGRAGDIQTCPKPKLAFSSLTNKEVASVSHPNEFWIKGDRFQQHHSSNKIIQRIYIAKRPFLTHTSELEIFFFSEGAIHKNYIKFQKIKRNF